MSNIIRENALVYLTAMIESISSLSTVRRVKQLHSDLGNVAVTQFPIASVVGRLPQPNLKLTGRAPSGMDKSISLLRADIIVYAQVNENLDTLISTLANDIWVKIFSDQNLGGNVRSIVEFEFTEEVQYWVPFVAFKTVVSYQYIHGIGGI